MGVTARLDNFPRRHTWLGFPVAMVYIHRHTQPNSTDQPVRHDGASGRPLTSWMPIVVYQ
jgi:hypothetical protein